ncbi:MAG: hypothetical protein PVF37_20280 [Desulfobacterales bacterium]
MKSIKLPADRLGISNTIGLLILGTAITCLVLLFVHASFRSFADQRECRQLVRKLGINCLSLLPSGQPLRDIGMINPAIDLRFDPRIGRIHPDSADMILKPLRLKVSQ